MILKSSVYMKWGNNWLLVGTNKVFDNQPFVRLFGLFPEQATKLELCVHDQPVENSIKIHRAMQNNGCSNSFLFYKPDERGTCFQGVLSDHIASDLSEKEYWITGHVTCG